MLATDEMEKFAELIFKISEEKEEYGFEDEINPKIGSRLDQHHHLTGSALKQAVSIARKILPSKYPQLMELVRRVCCKDEMKLEENGLPGGDSSVEVPVEYCEFFLSSREVP